MAYVQEPIDRPYQIICEGADDYECYRRLVRDRNLAGYQVGCGRGKDGRCLGKDGFSTRIEAIQAAASVQLLGYVIIADGDDDPSERFKSACGHLRKTGLPVPDKPFEGSKTKDGIKTAVIMIPSEGAKGGLETLLLQCCSEITDYAECVDAFCACAGSSKRDIDDDKFRLRAQVAVTNRDDPGISITSWLSSGRRPFPMTHEALGRIADFLTTFAT